MKSRLFAAALGFALLGSTPAIFAQYGAQGYPPPQYAARGWDAPPGELRDFQRRGYVDGVQGAERDYENHRIWNVNNRDEYRHPNVPGNVRGDYRDGFKKGYYATVQHYQGAGPR